MAKSSVLEQDPTHNLKKELQRLVQTIVQDSSTDDESHELVDKAVQILQSLKDLKQGRKQGTKQGMLQYYPQEFICPLSKEIMTDPVIICTGKTYDRASIQEWFRSGKRTCPETGQVLSHTVMIPNRLVRDMIVQWCKNNGVGAQVVVVGPNPVNTVHYVDEHGLTEADREHFRSLLKKVSASDSITEKKEAAGMLRSLTKKIPGFRGLFGECGTAIPELLTPLSGMENGVDPSLCEDVITTLLNVSIYESNKKLVAETPNVIPVLLDALRLGTIETRANAAATLFTLSALDSNKLVIGKAGGLKPLIELLEEGHALAMKDVASAIFNLCIVHENKTRAVRDGAVSVLLDKINHRVLVDELLAILAMLSSNQKAVEEMSDGGAVSCLFSLIRETTCERNKENCITIMHAICFSDRTKWKEMKEEESRYETLSQLAENGTSRAKRKANGILDRINRLVNRTNTA